MSRYGVISGPYFPVYSPNTGKYGPEITPYLDAFHNSESIKRLINKNANVSKCFRYRLQILFMIISEFKQINEPLLPLEPSAVIE